MDTVDVHASAKSTDLSAGKNATSDLPRIITPTAASQVVLDKAVDIEEKGAPEMKENLSLTLLVPWLKKSNSQPLLSLLLCFSMLLGQVAPLWDVLGQLCHSVEVM